MAPTVTFDLENFDLQDNDRSIELKTFNLETLTNKFIKSPTNSISVHKLYLSEGECAPKLFRAKFAAKVTTAGITGRDFGSGKSKRTVFSLGIIPADNVLETLSLLEENTCATAAPDFEVVSLIKNDRLYLKLKLDGKKFQVKSNIPLNPKKLSEGITQGDDVTVTAEFSLYVNMSEGKVGITITPLKLEFESVPESDTE